MKKEARNLHGSAPEKCHTALLLIDVINAMDFDGGEKLAQYAHPAAQNISKLKAKAHAAKIPVIYVNDNFGKWRSDFQSHVEHCIKSDMPGQKIVKLLIPEQEDYYVLKPKHSGFYSTSLNVLLEYLEVKKLVLTGFAGNLCVLYTANDAYMRDYELLIPCDCIASENETDHQHALEQMKKNLKAETYPSSNIEFHQLNRD